MRVTTTIALVVVAFSAAMTGGALAGTTKATTRVAVVQTKASKVALAIAPVAHVVRLCPITGRPL
jgi:hypothetical protein